MEGSQAYQITGMSALFASHPSFPPSFLSSIPYLFLLLPSILPLFLSFGTYPPLGYFDITLYTQHDSKAGWGTSTAIRIILRQHLGSIIY